MKPLDLLNPPGWMSPRGCEGQALNGHYQLQKLEAIDKATVTDGEKALRTMQTRAWVEVSPGKVAQ